MASLSSPWPSYNCSINERELGVVCDVLGVAPGSEREARCEALRARFGLATVVLTRGANGTVLVTAGGTTTGTPVRFEAEEGADSVGAGDACSAGVLVGMLLGWPLDRVVGLANTAGAFVAARRGATPRFPAELIRLVGTTAERPGG